MRAIKLFETTITNSQVPPEFKLSYRKEFLRLVDLIPEGVTAAQMKSALKVSAALSKTPEDGTLYLEDADWEYLKGKISAAKWTFVAPEIVEMVEAVELATEVEAPHLKAVENKQATA